MEWRAVRPADARALTDSRLQLHHAAQLATALGISYLPHAADDSHTNLEWLPAVGALASRPVGALRVAVRVRDLTVLVANDALPLVGKTIAQAADCIRDKLSAAGLDRARYTLARHYEIPPHVVAKGAPFNAVSPQLEPLAAWFGNAAMLLESVRASTPGASEVRCWPHHFDIATLITIGSGRTIGVGLEPGDVYYDEPYFYVNAYPQPNKDALPNTLEGGGTWHTHEWIGAVLPGSRLSSDAAEQQTQARAFLLSAVKACRSLLRS